MALRHLDSSLRHARGGSREGSRQFRELRQQVAQQSPLSGEGKADEAFANVIDSFEKKLEAAKAKGDTTLVAQLNSRIQTEFGIDPEHIDPNVTKGFKKLFEEQKKQLGAWKRPCSPRFFSTALNKPTPAHRWSGVSMHESFKRRLADLEET